MGFVRVLAATLLCLGLAATSFAQMAYLTGQQNNARTGANVHETLLTPANVNKGAFGRLFSYQVDYQVLAQPLYVPNVNIPGLGVHNVVYVATMNDSVYAFDADGLSGQPLWQVSFLDPANGVTIASANTQTLPCASVRDNGPGFHMEGIVATPVIDLNAGSAGVIYLVAKTVENGTVRHRLHALDITTGQEEPNSPVLISASSTSNKGHIVAFNSLHQKNRPGLLLNNGVLYLGFGSNFCNDANTGWVLSYDEESLTPLGAFNTNPDHGLTSIWQSGVGLAADDQGFVYAETAEGNFDLDKGGQGYTDSVLKFTDSPLGLVDFFTPSNVLAINKKDQDLSSAGVVVMPDQNGAVVHELVASGKQGTIYLVNRDNMGQYSPSTDQVVQELPFVLGEFFGSPAYWNKMLYFNSANTPLKTFSLVGGALAPAGMTAQSLTGSHSPTVSANGAANGILWVIGGTALFAFDAVTLNLLYGTNQVPARDALPPITHFNTQTVVNGRVYVATKSSLEVYGLLDRLDIAAGANQTAPVNTALPIPIQIDAQSFYSHQPVVGVAVTFSDGGKGGRFDPPTAITNDNGIATSVYTLPKKVGTYTITAATPGFLSITLKESATPGPPTRATVFGGSKQTGTVGTVLPAALVAQVQDAYKNGVPGATVNFTDNGKGGVLNPASGVTDANGKVAVTYQLPPTPGKYTVVESSPGVLTFNKFIETATP